METAPCAKELVPSGMGNSSCGRGSDTATVAVREPGTRGCGWRHGAAMRIEAVTTKAIARMEVVAEEM